MRILVVEDDPSIRDMIHECLSDEGYMVAAARHGQEALRMLRERPPSPDLILLDLAMPVMNGWEFLAVQQGELELAAIPVIVFSAARSVLKRDDLPAGITAVAKPIDLEVLLEMISRHRARV